MPEVVGLADLLWQYSQGVQLTKSDLEQLDRIIEQLRAKELTHV